MAQTVKNLSTMQETWVRSLGQEDPLEKGMATHEPFSESDVAAAAAFLVAERSD